MGDALSTRTGAAFRTAVRLQAERNDALARAVDLAAAVSRAGRSNPAPHAVAVPVDTAPAACTRCAALHPRLEHLARLYVSMTHLYGARDRDTVIAAVSEILVNMVGSEDWVVVATDAAGATVPLASMGADGPALGDGHARAVAAALRGEASVAVASSRDDATAAYFPLLRRGQVGGAVVVRSLLRQRERIGAEEEEIIELLRDHALPALLAARPAAPVGG